MVAVAARETAARMRPARMPRVRIFISVYFLVCYFFLGAAGRTGALVDGRPGASRLTSQPQSSAAFLAVFWYLVSGSMITLGFVPWILWDRRRHVMEGVGGPDVSRWCSSA